jgi:seryl-tRNA synthetase
MIAIEQLIEQRNHIAQQLQELKNTSSDYKKIKELQKERARLNNNLAQIRFKLKNK